MFFFFSFFPPLFFFGFDSRSCVCRAFSDLTCERNVTFLKGVFFFCKELFSTLFCPGKKESEKSKGEREGSIVKVHAHKNEKN